MNLEYKKALLFKIRKKTFFLIYNIFFLMHMCVYIITIIIIWGRTWLLLYSF